MTLLTPTTSSDFDRLVEDYATALSEFEDTTSENSSEQALHLLLTRDAIASRLSGSAPYVRSSVNKLLQLDERLKKQGNAIAAIANLDEWRTSLQPPDSSWWWFFQQKKEVHTMDRFDWVWNGLSVVCLTAFVAYMTSLAPRFATGGFDILESFGVIGPSGLLALAFSSLKGGAGQQVVRKGLKAARIPSHLESEATCGLAAVLLGGALVTQAQLPNIAQSYYKQGMKYYNQGLLRRAESQYKQALNLAPDRREINIALGEVYESIGELGEAEKQYKIAIENGTASAFNHLGRVYRQKGNPVTAEAMFRIGLQRVRSEAKQVQFQLHRNLGWVLLDQKKYQEAVLELEKAIAIDKSTPEREIGEGMANCLLAKTLEFTGDKERSQRQWKHCQTFARPETIDEFEWLVEAGQRQVASAVDTTSIIGEEKAELGSAFPLLEGETSPPEPTPTTLPSTNSSPGSATQPTPPTTPSPQSDTQPTPPTTPSPESIAN